MQHSCHSPASTGRITVSLSLPVLSAGAQSPVSTCVTFLVPYIAADHTNPPGPQYKACWYQICADSCSLLYSARGEYRYNTMTVVGTKSECTNTSTLLIGCFFVFAHASAPSL